MQISVRTHFSKSPGPRYRSEGKHSGQEFRESILTPAIKEAQLQKHRILVDLDGTSGFGTSFLEESFGGLIRVDGFRLAELTTILDFRSEDEPELLDEINSYMTDADIARSKLEAE